MGRISRPDRAVRRGVFAVDWGCPADEPLVAGMAWQWRGQALRLDGRADVLLLGRPLARNDARPRARSRAARLHGPAAPRPHPSEGQAAAELLDEAPPEAPPGGMLLTDGQRLYPARLIETSRGRVIVFEPLLPPPGRELWVTSLCEGMADRRGALAGAPGGGGRGGIGGITSGALVLTPEGPQPIEALMPGDRVLTRDHGAQPVLWCGQTRFSGAELALHPQLRPFRLRLRGASRPAFVGGGDGPADTTRPRELLLAPDHRLVVPALPGLDAVAHRATEMRDAAPGTEALARIVDLEDGRLIRRDVTLRSVVYHHLLLARHEILTVNGLMMESFHPDLADPVALRWHARDLERAAPGATTVQGLFGDPARRCLSRGEAALLAYAA